MRNQLVDLCMCGGYLGVKVLSNCFHDSVRGIGIEVVGGEVMADETADLHATDSEKGSGVACGAVASNYGRGRTQKEGEEGCTAY